MEEAIVLYPSPAIGHLISMVELGKLILTQKPSLTIHILISNLPYNSGPIAPYIASVSSTTSSIIFHHLPPITLPPTTASSSSHHEILALESLRLNNPNVHQALLSISENYTIQAFIMDFFCVHGLSVAAQLHVPAYFFTCGAGSLALYLYFPTIHQNTKKSFKDSETLLVDVPGMPPMRSSDIPKVLQDRTDKSYEMFLYGSTQTQKSAGAIVNTFEALESRTIKAISDGLCVPGNPTPPVYCIGPLVAAEKQKDSDGGGGGNGVPECLKWLDSQPSQSVVFLCFGSLGAFSKEQLEEIAVGLERSGLRFLWVVRNQPPRQDQNVAISASPDPDLDSLLPDGFLGRTKERGLVVKRWVPQVAVLNHNSVGGFVTHSGWNSVLEAVCAGVPMVSWPLYAEQRVNRVVLVEEMRIALPMNESKDGFVSAAEVEKRVKELMESEEGESIRERVVGMKNEAEAAMSEKGSSRVALTKLVESWSN